MDIEKLSAATFCDLAQRKMLPEQFVVEEEVHLNLDGCSGPIISRGRFHRPVIIGKGASINAGVNFLRCRFYDRLSIEVFSFPGHLSFQDCILQELSLSSCAIRDNFIWTNNVIRNLSIVRSTWEIAFVDDYRVAQVLSLAKQGIYIDLDKIPQMQL